MAKNINRKVFIYINGREVENTLQSIRNEVGTDTAFLTSSKKIIEQVGGMQCRFPFRATMKCVAYGGAFIGFRLFPPSAEVTDDDRRLFQQYKKTKFKR